MNRRTLIRAAALGLVLSASPFAAQAQWLTQTNALKQGWNAVYLHVDPSHDTLNNLIGSAAAVATSIEEVWLWMPNPSTVQYIQSPHEPVDGGTQWMNWKKADALGSQLQRAVGNAAYLVYCSADYTWEVKGRPLAPSYPWSVSGLNLFGFPTAPVNAPDFDSFLSQSPPLLQNLEVFRYVGGDLGAGNPAPVTALRVTRVNRGQAYWLRATDLYNRYFSPFDLRSVRPGGIHFGDNLGAIRFRLRNLSKDPLTVTVEHVASETPPGGETAIAAAPPLLVRGEINVTNLTYAYSNLSVGGSHSWTLQAAGQPGSEVEVALGLNRSAIANAPGELLASVLRFTDSLGHSQIDVSVSAEAASQAGLWVGAASVNQVRAFLKSYQKDADGAPVVGANNAYVVTGVNTNLGAVARPFPLRLILHVDDSATRLLQRVYYGLDPGTNFINATRQSLLDPNRLATARRISAVHLPFSPGNAVWNFDNMLQPNATLTVANVSVPHLDHASNPFLHTFHPDHDNLDAQFNLALAAGFESYSISRAISLTVTPLADDFESLTRGGRVFSGVYLETVTLDGKGSESRGFESRGVFSLTRINDIATLTTN